jgi:hypothetical protein
MPHTGGVVMSTVLYPSALLAQDIEDAYTCEHCNQPATVDAVRRKCNHGALLCNNHLVSARERFARLAAARATFTCFTCHVNLGQPPTFDHMVKVTPL